MATIPLPAKFSLASVESFRLSREGNVARSRYTGKRQVIVYPYALWNLKVSLIDYPELEAKYIRGFLAALEGQKNNFQFPVPGYKAPSSGYAGVLTASALTNAQSSSMQVNGTANSNGILLTGEFVTVNGELKILTQDLNIAAGGTGTMFFQPALRANVAAGTAIIYNNPYALMCSNDDDIADWGIKPPVTHAFKLEFIEDY